MCQKIMELLIGNQATDHCQWKGNTGSRSLRSMKMKYVLLRLGLDRAHQQGGGDTGNNTPTTSPLDVLLTTLAAFVGGNQYAKLHT